MATKIDIMVKKIRVIKDWYEVNYRTTVMEHTISIESAERLLRKLEEIK